MPAGHWTDSARHGRGSGSDSPNGRSREAIGERRWRRVAGARPLPCCAQAQAPQASAQTSAPGDSAGPAAFTDVAGRLQPALPPGKRGPNSGDAYGAVLKPAIAPYPISAETKTRRAARACPEVPAIALAPLSGGGSLRWTRRGRPASSARRGIKIPGEHRSDGGQMTVSWCRLHLETAGPTSLFEPSTGANPPSSGSGC